MKANEVCFDEDFEMYIRLPNMEEEVCIILSEDLAATNEPLTDDYKSKIAQFINQHKSWYNNAMQAIITHVKEQHNIDTKPEDLLLMNIYILFEQQEDELFGLGYRADFDIEHGAGVKISGKKGKYAISEIGAADVSFC